MGILDDDVARVREASDIVAIVSQYTQLKRVGRRFTGLCPFHSEKSPSFSVNGEQGLYYCFGCQAKGDTITFVREIEHLDFVGAVEMLAGKAGITLRYTDQNEGESRKRKARLIEVMERAVDWYHERLMSGADAGPARGYLRSRGFTKESVERYRLGWAPDDWDQLAQHLKVSDDVLRDTGLGLKNRRGRQQDFLRGRVLFPIFDVNGDPVAIGGRIMPGAEGPKYINSQETPIYSKGRVLYGLNWAKSDIVNADQVIICEGYTDVIGFAEAGLGRAVATCGTALTESHVQVLRKYARRVVLAFDADNAGQAAAERFYEWESKYEIQVQVANLPRGVDPADLAREDPAALEAAVAEAKPFLGFRLDRALAGVDSSSPESSARGAGVALAMLAEHPDPKVHDRYLNVVADRCGIREETLRGELGQLLRRSKSDSARGDTTERLLRRVVPSTEERRSGPEMEALRLAIHRRDEIVGQLDPWLFADPIIGAAIAAIADAADVRAALDEVDPAVAELLQRAVQQESEADPDDVVSLLVTASAQRALHGYEVEARNSDDPLGYSEIIGWLRSRIIEMRDEHAAPEARKALLDWLGDQARGES